MPVGKGPGLTARSMPKPSAATVTEAHNLLSLMGDPKRVKEPLAMLAEMRDVQTHNEAVVGQVRTLISDADDRIKTADAAEGKAGVARQKLADETATAAAQLSRQRTETERAQQQLDREKAANAETVAAIDRAKTLLRPVAVVLKAYAE